MNFDHRCRTVITVGCIALFQTIAFAENPFLFAKDDQPKVTRFRGTEWGDDISDDDDEDDLPLSALVTTTRLAQVPWGAIFKIAFTEIRSRASRKRELPAYYFIVTDREIVLLNEPHIDEAIRRLSALEAAPVFAQEDIYAVKEGSRSYENGDWKMIVETKGDTCIYQANHPSGHFTHLVWKRGVGLIEISAGRGALADGYRLKRQADRAPAKG